jgi:flagellar protein FliS
MATVTNYLHNYQETEVKTADPMDLIHLLYKGAITRLKQAKANFNEIEARVTALNKACAIIGELQAALDLENGGEIASSLNQLYSYMQRRLNRANSHQDLAAINEVISLLSTLESAWREATLASEQQTQVPNPGSENTPFHAVAS